MKTSFLLLSLVVATACTGRDHDTTRTMTDTTVTPVHTTDTTVVQKKVEVKTDTVKQTHNKP